MPAINIGEQLTSLRNLQQLDAQLYRLRQEREARPLEIAALQRRQQEREQAAKAVETQAQQLQLRHKEKEVELGTKEAEIKKLQTQLFQVKTNKEYLAMQQEIESRKADNSLFEEEIIRLLDAIDRAKRDAAQAKDELAAQARRTDEAIQRLHAAVGELDRQIAALEARRAALTPAVEPATLSLYERILRNREGAALAAVRGESCGGCYMQLRPQVVNEARLQHRLVVCDNCARILYWDEAAGGT